MLTKSLDTDFKRAKFLDFQLALNFCPEKNVLKLVFVFQGTLKMEKALHARKLVSSFDEFRFSPNSMQVMPSDQTSTFPSYWPSSMARMTSGAIQ